MTNARAASVKATFEAAGALPVDLPILLPADALLDLYGEDIRGRAYITADALRGEQMLRPDFTVPVVQQHMSHGAEPARYTYAGQVFRRQDDNPDRPNEYLQVGFEVFDGANPPAADAEVFAQVFSVVAHLNLRAVTGDIGLLLAAVAGLRTSDRRKAALVRHIWRPRRFRVLLDRFTGKTAIPEPRKAMIEGRIMSDVPLTGLRTEAEIADRLHAIRADAEEPPISRTEAA
jgi:ATP phosphoribosyltransferase regulatory subunit